MMDSEVKYANDTIRSLRDHCLALETSGVDVETIVFAIMVIGTSYFLEDNPDEALEKFRTAVNHEEFGAIVRGMMVADS